MSDRGRQDQAHRLADRETDAARDSAKRSTIISVVIASIVLLAILGVAAVALIYAAASFSNFGGGQRL